jgi:hypothetical protein
MIRHMSGSGSEIENNPGDDTCVRWRCGYLYPCASLLLRNQQYPVLFLFSKNDQIRWICLSVSFGTSKLQFMRYMSGFGIKNAQAAISCVLQSFEYRTYPSSTSLIETQLAMAHVFFRSASQNSQKKTRRNRFYVHSVRKSKKRLGDEGCICSPKPWILYCASTTLFSKFNTLQHMLYPALILENYTQLNDVCLSGTPKTHLLTIHERFAETARQRPHVVSKFISITQSSSQLHITTAFCNIINSVLRKHSASSGRAQECDTQTLHTYAMLVTGSPLSTPSKSTSTFV